MMSRSSGAGGRPTSPKAPSASTWAAGSASRSAAPSGTRRADRPRKPGEARGDGEVEDAGEPKDRLRAGAADRRRARPERIGRDLGAAQPGERPPVAGFAATVGDRVRGGEGEPDRRAAPEEVDGVGRRLVVADGPQRRLRCGE